MKTVMLIRTGLIGSVAMVIIGCGSATSVNVSAKQAGNPSNTNMEQANVTLHLPGMNKKLKIM